LLRYESIVNERAVIVDNISLFLLVVGLDDPSIAQAQPESTGLCSSIDSATRSIDGCPSVDACANNRSLDGTARSIDSADRSIACNMDIKYLSKVSLWFTLHGRHDQWRLESEFEIVLLTYLPMVYNSVSLQNLDFAYMTTVHDNGFV